MPSRTPIAPPPRSGRFSRLTAVAILVSSTSVAASRSPRFRRRSSANTGLRHTTNRSPGYSGSDTSARLVSSNSDSWIVPRCANCLMAGARNAVIQSSPVPRRSSSMRALVIIPRSPTNTTLDNPNRSLILATWADTVAGSPVLPLKTCTATGQPSLVVSSP